MGGGIPNLTQSHTPRRRLAPVRECKAADDPDNFKEGYNV
jgi:hypothetical protein